MDECKPLPASESSPADMSDSSAPTSLPARSSAMRAITERISCARGTALMYRRKLKCQAKLESTSSHVAFKR